MNTLSFGRYRFTKLPDGTIRVEDGKASGVIPRGALKFSDLQRLAQTPYNRQLLARYLDLYLPVMVKK